MKRIRIIAILSAVVTAAALYLYLAGLNKPKEIERSPVVVAAVRIDAGQVVARDMVEVKNLPVEAVTANAARSVDEVAGRVCNARTEPGEQMLVSRFVTTGETADSLAFAVEEGKRAFTIPVDGVTGLAGLLRPRDRVDILLIISVADSAEGSDGTLTVTYSQILLQNLPVLATGNVMKEEGTGGEMPATVTLAVTPEQAVKLNLAMAQGNIRLVLRSPIDAKDADVAPMVVGELVE